MKNRTFLKIFDVEFKGSPAIAKHDSGARGFMDH